MATKLKSGLVVPTQYLVDPTSDLLQDAVTGSTVGYPVYYGGLIYGWLDSSGNVIVGEASPAGGISVGGFGGYDPERPPPGYDPVCWRAGNWDYNHGLVCRVTGSQTILETDLKRWTPWTMDLGQEPPPSGGAYSWAVAQGLSFPHPGPLTLTQAQQLLGAVQARPTMTLSEYLAEVSRIKGTGGTGYLPPTNLVLPEEPSTPGIQGPIPPGPSLPTGGVTTTPGPTPTMAPQTGITPQVPLIPQGAGPTYTPPPLTIGGGGVVAGGTTGTPTTPPTIIPEGPRTAAPLGLPMWAWFLLGAGVLFLAFRGGND